MHAFLPAPVVGAVPLTLVASSAFTSAGTSELVLAALAAQRGDIRILHALMVERDPACQVFLRLQHPGVPLLGDLLSLAPGEPWAF